MTELITILTTINTLVSTFRDIILIAIVIFGFKYLGKEIGKGIKQVPEWVEKYQNMKDKSDRIKWARGEK